MMEQLLPYIGAAAVALISAAATVLVGRFVYKATRKGDEATEKLTARRDTIADRDGLIATLNARLDGMETRLKNAEDEIQKVRNHNNALVTFTYKMLAIIRRHDLTEEIDPEDVPDGIHV